MARTPHILIADDDRSIRLTLETGLALNGFRVTSARSGREALQIVRNGEFDLVLSDIYMPDGGGLDLVRELRSFDPAIPIILMTAQGSVEVAMEAVLGGANDFIGKPFEIAAVVALVRRFVQARREADAAPEGVSATDNDLSGSGLVGRSAAMAVVYKIVAQAARSEAAVLITGESGTGKELVARAIHQYSRRAGRPFLTVNCAGLTDTLLESELFGYVRGAFTGATGDRAGLFEAADGGTLFLDELASTSPAFQASLLRVLQSGEVRRVGATQARRVDVRVIGASNSSLRDLSATGGFRPDLLYRLSVLSIDLPALRARSGDVELLTAQFLKRFQDSGQPALHLSHEAKAALLAHPFPGNVRELENALRRAVALSTNGLITIDCLPPEITEQNGQSGAASTAGAYRLLADRPTMDELQRRYLLLTLEETGWNRRRAAAVLALDRRTIQRLIARYQLHGTVDPESDLETELDSEALEKTPDIA